MKRLMIFAGLFMFMFCVVITAQTDDRTTSSTDKTSSKNANSAKSNDKTVQFVKEAASGGMMEVKLGKLAETKASSKEVKNFGAMMVKDHSKANDQLKALAKKNNITVPTMLMKNHQKNVDELSKLSGKDFDEEYIHLMVKDHKEDISKFEEASKDSSNTDVKNFAKNTLPTLKHHYEEVQKIEKGIHAVSRGNDKEGTNKENKNDQH